MGRPKKKKELTLKAGGTVKLSADEVAQINHFEYNTNAGVVKGSQVITEDGKHHHVLESVDTVVALFGLSKDLEADPDTDETSEAEADAE